MKYNIGKRIVLEFSTWNSSAYVRNPRLVHLSSNKCASLPLFILKLSAFLESFAGGRDDYYLFSNGELADGRETKEGKALDPTYPHCLSSKF
ncbi:hypothetical protein TcasGA2_TC001532 [Tribolium castaneum]|uniref:Uncharacterized protein n=1 Tax=Tribolium castaneum TaxID=7070 RepID=D7EI50_TRICA|nr:hypothetical protein TcasGA2_TC001532 [Tribolium castaneum]